MPGYIPVMLQEEQPWPLPWADDENPVTWANEILGNRTISPDDGRFQAAMHLVGLLEETRKMDLAKQEIAELKAENDRLRNSVVNLIDQVDDYDLRRLVVALMTKA